MMESAKNICIELLRAIKNPTVEDLNNAINDVCKIFPGISSSRESLYNFLYSTFSIFSEEYRILDADEGYQPWLKDTKAEIEWRFWNRYTNYLQKKIAPDTINKLDNLTDDILDRISNPKIPGVWDKRGMVVGQVQSGKTSNYIGLINKAADAGYKLIIVLAGMHDSLRSQTQIRIDEGFLGFNSQRSLQYSTTNKIGVGFYNSISSEPNKYVDLPANALTSSHLDGDFNRRAALSAGIHLRGTDPIVAVVKKNSSILKNLIAWFATWGDKQQDGKIQIRNLPLLLIDDEADNASINVSKEKVSAINGCIRALLSLFEQSAYVGYTATPFANVFIQILNEEKVKGLDLRVKDYEFSVGQDLFPKDFIINIPAPSNYIGPEKIFGLPALNSAEVDIEPLPLIRLIRDYDSPVSSPNNTQGIEGSSDAGLARTRYISFIPDSHKKDDPLPTELPDSLKHAIKCFILSCTARRLRNQINVHNSMLIHVSRYIIWQDRIANLTDKVLKFYQKQIELNTGNLINELHDIWDDEFVPVTKQVIDATGVYHDSEVTSISWEEVEKELYPAISKIEVRAVHGDKNLTGLTHHNISPLDYFVSEQKGNFLSVIAVGGDKLSRGLTLEGLTISYYLRASKMYDTLMQMGRWFGYRPGYVDLCRIFTSDELNEWYKHITIASEEMRRDFDYMFLLKKTPKEFGLKVRTHPGVLRITAANKFRYSKLMSLSYSGQLEQTYQFKVDKTRFKVNFEAANALLTSLGTPLIKLPNSLNPKQELIWRSEENYSLIIEFLSRYQIGQEVIDTTKIVDYINAQIRKGNLVNWTVAFIVNSRANPEYEYYIPALSRNIGLTDRTNISKDPGIYSVAKYNITDHRHELIDLSQNEVEHALKMTEEDIRVGGDLEKPVLPSRKRIKWVRSTRSGLLLLYPLNHNCQHIQDGAAKPKILKRKPISDFPIVGIAVSFPENENDEKVEYAVNEQFRMEYEYPEELDLMEENGSD